jgi:hypothetical protein
MPDKPEDPPDEQTPSQVGRLARINDSPLLGIGAKGATILGFALALLVAFGVIAYLRASIGSTRIDNTVRSTSRGLPEQSASSTSIRSSSATASPIGIGSCLSSDATQVSCSTAHSFEIYAQSKPCASQDLLKYLGGSPGVDTISPLIQTLAMRFGDSDWCVVKIPAGSATMTVARSLDGADGATWRRCLDDRYGDREVLCSQPHTTEVAFSGSVAASQTLDCVSRASMYLDADVSSSPSQLSISKATQGKLSICLLRVRGENYLVGSIRRLGTETLPIFPD